MIALSDIPLFLYFQFVSAFLALWFFKKNSFFGKALTVLLCITFLVECLGTYFSVHKQYNFSLYHGYTLVEFSLILILYRGIIKEKKYLTVSYVILIIFLAFWLLTFFDKKYLFTTMVIGAFNVGVLIFLYLRELLLSDKLINFKRLLEFWVSVGFIVFYLPSIPFFSFWNFMKDRSLVPILESLIILMNIIISFGLIWSNKKEEF